MCAIGASSKLELRKNELIQLRRFVYLIIIQESVYNADARARLINAISEPVYLMLGII